VELCNSYGLDPTSTGSVIAFAMDCYEHGILSKKDTDDLDLKFGNSEAMIEMINKIGVRDGLGDILAEGVKRAAEKIGKGAERYANHVKGLEMTGYDIRGLKTGALGYAVSFSGADNSRHAAFSPDLVGRLNRFKAEKGKGEVVKNIEDLYTVLDSLIVCKYSRGSYHEGFEALSKIYTLVTDIKMTSEELRIAGERINNLGRLFNIREGFTRKDDHLPAKVMNTPIPDVGAVSKGSVVTQKELNSMLDGYYKTRGWTTGERGGIPKTGKLEKLGLKDFAYVINK
jgi:aldehyde:ferredoxin oxidoreductase